MNRNETAGPRLFYEKRIRSRAQLTRELRNLDNDAGVRMSGRYKGKRCFAFVSRSGTTFVMMIYSVVNPANPRPGRRLMAKEFEAVGELEGFLEELAGDRLQAFVY